MVNIENKFVLTVEDIKEILGIGFNSAYELVKNSQKYNFEAYKIGRQYVVPKNQFLRAFGIIEESKNE